MSSWQASNPAYRLAGMPQPRCPGSCRRGPRAGGPPVQHHRNV